MKALGAAFIILGLLLVVFDLSGCEAEKPSTITDWVYTWGKSAAWAIKIGMVVLGIALVSASNRRPK